MTCLTFPSFWGVSFGTPPSHLFHPQPLSSSKCSLPSGLSFFSSLISKLDKQTSILGVHYFSLLSLSSFRVICFDIIYHGLSLLMIKKGTNEMELVKTWSQGFYVLWMVIEHLLETWKKQGVWEQIMDSCGWGQRWGEATSNQNSLRKSNAIVALCSWLCVWILHQAIGIEC